MTVQSGSREVIRDWRDETAELFELPPRKSAVSLGGTPEKVQCPLEVLSLGGALRYRRENAIETLPSKIENRIFDHFFEFV